MKEIKIIIYFITLLLIVVNTYAYRGGRRISSLYLRDDPDDYRTFQEIIETKGYPCEQHFVTTDDGYILQMFRIPFGRSSNLTDTFGRKQPVLLQHGLLDSSITWIVNMPDQSLPYILADNGYDVWMGNNRGNTYSLNHTTLLPSNPLFWDFSFDEMGRYDMPAMINYIRHQTGYESLPYVGHSEGTIQAWIGYLTNSSLSDWAPVFFALGPVANVTNISNNGLRDMADRDIDISLAKLGFNRFLPTPSFLRSVFIDFCLACDSCCAGVIEFLCGPHRGAFNDTRMSMVAGHEPAGTSIRNMEHWAQGVREKQFQAFDYGTQGNIQHYKQTLPPIYDLSKFPTQVKVFLVSGKLDELADPLDVASIAAQLPPQSLINWKVIDDYAHLDYVWAIDAHTTIYDDIIQSIQKYF